jgi:signal transduction histidine kinase
VSLWFPPSGVAIALAIWFGPPIAIVTGLVSTVMAPLWGNQGWTQWVGWTDATEPLIAWWLYRQVWQRSINLNRLRDVSTFIFSAPVIACASSAIVGSFTLALVGNLSWQAILPTISNWWLGNAIGTMVIAPVAILTLTPILQASGYLPPSIANTILPTPPQNASRLRAKKITIFVLSLAIAILSVSQTNHTGFAFQQFSFLNFIPVLWAALQFGAIGGITTAGFCVITTLLSYIVKYPEALAPQNFPVDPEVLAVHRLSLLTQCIVGLLTGTAITQQTQAQVKLAISQIQLAEYKARSWLNERFEATNRTLSKTNAQLAQANRDKDELLIREQAARSQAEAANQVKDEFLAIVSHELRTPLNPILGWAKLLQSDELDPATIQNALTTIVRNATLQAQLIDDLLDVSRILRGKLMLNKIELDLDFVIRTTIDTVQLSATAKAITLTFTSSKNSKVLVYGDLYRLQQVMTNLLTNAIKFTPQGGRVTVTLEELNSGNNSEGAKHQQGSIAQIRVSDTGKGIEPGLLPHVFEPFWQEDSKTTRNFGGLGLGLAIVRHLVELHHGKIAVHSDGANGGATFFVQLPAIFTTATTSPIAIPQTAPQATSSLKDKQA